MRWEEAAPGLRIWHFDFDGEGVLAGVTARHGGVSTGSYESLNLGYHVGDDPAAVAENRSRLCSSLEVPQLTVADQQHRDRVAVIDGALAGAGHASVEDSLGRLPATDAMVTDLPGVALTIMVADCAPVVFYDPRGALGVAHVGRGGAVLDVVGATVATMKDRFGTDPTDLRVGVGPCINRSRYEIGGSALEDTRRSFPDPGLFDETSPGHACFDLAAAVTRRLEAAGIASNQIEVARVDTYGSPDFFSDRAVRPCGRFMLVASLRA